MKWQKWVANMCAVLIVFLAVLADVIYFFPVDVLQGFVVSVPDKTYQAGDTITYTTHFTKVRNVNGFSTRTIQCGNTEYPVSNSHGTRPPGKGGGKVDIVVPETIPTPARCRVHVHVDYKVFKFRSFHEDAYSNGFDVRP